MFLNRRLWAAAALFFILLAGRPLYAEPVVITDANIGDCAAKIKAAGREDFLVVQVSPGKMDEKSAGELRKWVEKGGCLWFYDSRIAHYFDLRSQPVVLKDMPSKQMDAEFGSGTKITGVAVGVQGAAGNPVTFGVRKLVVFLPKVGEKQYSAVAADPDALVLLTLPQTSSIVSCRKQLGKGYVFFKPLLWEKHYDGASFQRRLIHFSSNRYDE